MVRPRLPKLPKSIEEAAEWYMRYVSPLSLVAALFIDTFFLLRRVDTLLTSLVLFFYLALAASIIVLISLIQTGRLRQWWLLAVTPILPVVSQFAFGGLFIPFLSLYSRSAAYSWSWIFVVALIVLLVANERFVRFYMHFAFQVSIFFTVLFSFLIFYIPLVFRAVSPEMFVASGVASLMAVAAFLRVQAYLTPELVRENLTGIARSVAVIFVTFNILYFTGAIPPLPLALKEAGIYHGIARAGDEYRALYEPVPWYRGYLLMPAVFHRAPGEPAYAFSAVFAPVGLSTTVYHEWQRLDETGRGVTVETGPVSIAGGREGGYRGYSVLYGIASGKWRVTVKTGHGQIIGRIAFDVVDVGEPVPLETVVR